MKQAALRATAWNRKVHYRTKRDGTLIDTMEVIDKAADVWNTKEAIVILHAGLNDIQGNDAALDDLAERLQSQITRWKERAEGHFFVVYGVPEIGPRDDPSRAKCASWNRKIRQACSDIGTRVEFVSVARALQDKLRDTCYSDYVAEQLGQRLGRRICAFLGLRPSDNPQRKTWGADPTTTIMTALGQAILQIASPQKFQKRFRRQVQRN
ncbi:hypothetical protein HPB50_015032 [Hyalomma asiaticum]|uniref:Uncharacterized protein n=1 Tax=Hyalomma asiaticum TaxID=266040 RepID=A0ACB7SNM9_HYAAI|nr:hypothetical protein HPB50_015032 [Hyalomma asiaticum]